MNVQDTKIGSTVIIAVVAVLLQIILAPSIAISGVVPNFILVAVVISALQNTQLRSTIFGFILGLIFDLITQGPFGCMSLILTVLGFGVSSMNKGAFSEGLLTNMIILLLAALLGEFLNSIIYAVVGIDSEFLLSLLIKVLPGTIYDSLCGLIVLLIYNFFTGNRSNSNYSNRSNQGRPLRRKLN